MPTQESNTAADRLYRIIRSVYDSRDGQLLNLWGQALNLPNRNKLEVFRGILQVAALVDEIEVNIRKQGGNATNLYVRALNQVRNALMVNLDNHRGLLNEALKPEVVTDLEHCAAKYSEIDHEIPVPNEEITAIKKRADELFDDISHSNHLPTELRQKLLDLLDVIRQQISQFQIRGVTALHECLRQSLARLMEIYPAVLEKRDEPLLKRVVSVVTDISTICDKAQKAIPLLKYAGKIIPLLTSGNGHTATISDVIDAEVLTDGPK